MFLTSEIHMRDPFVYVQDGVYYLIGTTDPNAWSGPFVGFDMFTSSDLKTWDGPFPAFRPGENFFADRNFWAPEIHKFGENYYIFASFKSEKTRRGTAVLISTTGLPLGPYKLHSPGNITPADWECLDGTLYISKNGAPWMVFCHEWVQEGGGTICAMPLSDGLSGPTGEAITIFSASDVPWTKRVVHSSGMAGHVTDGPFMYRPKSGGLWMLWSSMTESGYGIGMSSSASGSILGPWTHQKDAIFRADGGHGMVFTDNHGKLLLTIHTPNKTPFERPIFLELVEIADGLSIL